MIWNGINVSIFGPIITLEKPRSTYSYCKYSGYDEVSYFRPEFLDIPLDIRYKDFCERLKNRLVR